MIRNKYLYVVLVVMSVLASCSPDDRMGLEEPIQDLKIIVKCIRRNCPVVFSAG